MEEPVMPEPDQNATTSDGTATTTAVAATGGNTSGDTSAAGDAFKPPASQEELNRLIAERVRREAAKYQDYGDLKKKAQQFDAIAEAQKTELQRAQERAEAAEQRAQKLEMDRQLADWRTQIAQEAGVPAGVLRGTTQEELLAHAAELKALLPDPNARPGAFVAGEGRQAVAAKDPAMEFADIVLRQRGIIR